jgi:hypothetical protein
MQVSVLEGLEQQAEEHMPDLEGSGSNRRFSNRAVVRAELTRIAGFQGQDV